MEANAILQVIGVIAVVIVARLEQLQNACLFVRRRRIGDTRTVVIVLLVLVRIAAVVHQILSQNSAEKTLVQMCARHRR